MTTRVSEVSVKVVDATCSGVMLTGRSTASRIGTERESVLLTRRSCSRSTETDKHLLIRSAGSADAPPPFFLFRDKDVRTEPSETRVALTSEKLKHDWVVISLRLADAVTMFRHSAAASLQACVASVVPPALRRMIWPGATRCTCPTKMMNSGRRITQRRDLQTL